jgi:hypothetical protein
MEAKIASISTMSQRSRGGGTVPADRDSTVVVSGREFMQDEGRKSGSESKPLF